MTGSGDGGADDGDRKGRGADGVAECGRRAKHEVLLCEKRELVRHGAGDGRLDAGSSTELLPLP
jgi:hypothetical protein